MVTRAGVSQSEFHEVFTSVEECFAAAFQESLARLTAAVERAAGREQRWLDRVRSGLVALLGFLDDEPGRGRLLLFAASAEPTVAFRYEQRVQAVLAGLLDDGTPPAIAQLTHTPALSAQLIRGGVLSVIRSRMSDPEQDGGPLVELAPPLTSFIAVAYLGQAAASEELLVGSLAADQPPRRRSRGAVAAASSLRFRLRAAPAWCWARSRVRRARATARSPPPRGSSTRGRSRICCAGSRSGA